MTTTPQQQQLDSNQRYLLQNLLRQGLGVVKEMWSFLTDDWVTSVHAGDIDGDGDNEVILGSRDGSVSVLTRKGVFKWREVEANSEWVGAIYGVDNVKALDRTRIIAGTRNNRVLALNEIGKRIWSYTADQVIRRVRVDDIDKDGCAEVLIGSEDLYIHALRSDSGELLWKYRTNGWVRAVFPIDVDGDGQTEIIAASGDKHIYILSNQGNLKKKIPAGSKIHALYAADLDGDDVVEILVGSDAKDLYAMTPDGEVKWTFRPKNRVHSINVVDLNNDGFLEIVAGSEDEHIYILDYRGQLLWKHHLGQRIFSIFTTDLNRDGINEVVVGAEDNNVWVLAVELQGDLLARIKATHAAMGSPHSSTLNLSTTEQELLHDLIDEPEPGEKELSIATLQRALTLEDPLASLEMLLYLKQQRVQLLWRDTTLGHVRIVTMNRLAQKAERELIVGTDEGNVLVLSTDGQLRWSYPTPERIRSLDIGDVDGDGEAELLVGCTNGYVYALSSQEPREKFHSDFIKDWIESIAIIHPPGSSSYEMVLGTTRSKELQFHRGKFEPVGTPFTIDQGVQILVCHDINGDGEDEILAGCLDKGVYAYTRHGELLWKYQTKDRVKTIVVYDIDHDGGSEILVGSEDRNVYVLDVRGKLLWRYDTQHRVLALGVLDAEGEGETQIFVGSGNGQLSVLNNRGDLLWRFQANDRIRSILVDDINNDGLVEVVVGTEDYLYTLQLLDQKRLETAIEQRWQELLRHQSSEKLVQELLHHPSAYLRAFVFNRQMSGSIPLDSALIQQLQRDSSLEVRRSLSELTPLLSRVDRTEVRQILDTLVADRHRSMRLFLVDCLGVVCRANPELGFEYLERLTRNVDLWVRHAVVRQLDHLREFYPEMVFALLMKTISDKADLWVRQESARVLAHYLDLHPSELLYTLRLLMVKNMSEELWDLVTYCSENVLVREATQNFALLCTGLTRENVLPRLERVARLDDGDGNRFIYGSFILRIYRELLDLSRMRALDKLAHYSYTVSDWPVFERLAGIKDEDQETDLLFDRTLQVLRQFEGIAEALRVYLRRSGLGERISSLLEADQAIETLLDEMGTRYFRDCPETFSDAVILRLLLARWREIIRTELSLIRGRADLVPELEAHQIVSEEIIVVPLSLKNIGSSSAENVTVRLLTEQDEKRYTLVGPAQLSFTTISAGTPTQAEFTLKPWATSFSLSFQIMYDDAEAKGKVREHGFRLDLVTRKRRVARLPNPYYTGTAVQNLAMFYGREKEIENLQEDFVYSQAPAVVVLYGQRRSGKSSLIYKLLRTSLLAPHIPVRIDMQHETLGFTIERFFHNVAYAIHHEAQVRGYELPFPGLAAFKEYAVFAFDRFLDDIEAWLGERKLVLLIDEFEVLDEKAETHQIDEHLFDHLRSLVQDRQCMHLLLAGTHKLEELTSAYWSVFFNLANHRRLANLTPEAAERLICEPMSEYLEYNPYAVQKIRTLTGDQPYLIQLFCHALVRHCQAMEKDYITVNDVNIVVEEVKQSGRQYFNWIWDEARGPERLILAIIAQASGDGELFVSLNDIERVFKEYHLSYTREEMLHALRKLRNGDIIIEVPHERRYKIAVGLTRLWLHESKPVQRVLPEQE